METLLKLWIPFSFLDTVEECLDERLSEFYHAINSGDAFVQHERVQEGEAHNVIYVGRSPSLSCSQLRPGYHDLCSGQDVKKKKRL